MKNVTLYLQSVLSYDRVDDVDSWFMVRTPVPMLTVLFAYLFFVLRLGPSWMSSRKPFNLQSTLIIYNFIALLMSAKMATNVMRSGLLSFLFMNGCVKHVPRHIRLLACELGWQFLILKIFELLDTVFFVLRKKQNQVSVLHVFHHTTMVFWTWMYLKYFPVAVAIPGATLNYFIHVAMYLYYLVAALGPQYQKYLWWKKYMTRIQILQFLTLLGYYSYLYVHDCGVPNMVIVIFSTNLMLFIILFSNFYIQCYRRSGKKLHDA